MKQSTKAATTDLSVGSPMKLILSFMMPLFLGLLFQQLYSMVDTMVVGKLLGVDALAGVGSTGSVNFLVLGLCNGICAGFAIPVAQKFGEKDFDGLRKFVGNMLWLGTIISLGVTAVTVAACRSFLIWTNTPEEVFEHAYDYIVIIFLAIPATMLYNILSGIIRSLGDSRTPLYFLILSSLLNVVLDIAFIVSFRMGVAGAGWATLLSQLISGLLCLVFIARRLPILRLRREDLRYRSAYARRLLAMGLPMGLQYSITAIGSILLQTAVNGLGASVMAAITAANKVHSLCTCPLDAMGTTVATFAGQNLGAGKPQRVRACVKDCAALGCGYAVIVFLISWFWGDGLTMLFLDIRDPAAAETILPLSRQFLLTCAAFNLPLMFIFVLRFTIQGLGFSELAMVAGVLEMIARAVFGLGLVPALGFQAVCFAHPAAWIMADLFLFPAYFHCLKKVGCQRERVLQAKMAKANS